MSSYKVAQDVEADDKLLGPFSFRQFVYLIIVAMAGLLAWGLSTLLLPLAILPLPIMLFFGALALPLRKDQPMETYLAAMISFYLKPRKRLWVPDGIQSLVEITVSQTEEVMLTKNLSEHEAARRLSYLADLSDSQGWSIRNTTMPSDTSSMHADIFNEATQAEDLLDDDGLVARSFDNMITQTDTRHKQALMAQLNSQLSQQQTTPPVTTQIQLPNQPVVITPSTGGIAQNPAQIQFNPYPTSIRQSVVQPLSDQHQVEIEDLPTPATNGLRPDPQVDPDDSDESTSTNTSSPDIISLANNPDLSIETIAREANRIKKKQEADDEVIISLR